MQIGSQPSTPNKHRLVNVQLTDPRVQANILHDIEINRANYPHNQSLYPIIQSNNNNNNS